MCEFPLIAELFAVLTGDPNGNPIAVVDSLVIGIPHPCSNPFLVEESFCLFGERLDRLGALDLGYPSNLLIDPCSIELLRRSPNRSVVALQDTPTVSSNTTRGNDSYVNSL